jgi:hypothetical protein
MDSIDNLFDKEPHFDGITTAEPSLREILFRYYQPHFGTTQAVQMTEQYIDIMKENFKCTTKNS